MAETLTSWSKEHWAWTGVLIICIIELVWIIVKLPIVGVFPITVAWAVLQVGIIALMTRKSVKDHFALSA